MSTRLVSVITPVHPLKATFLLDAYRSLQAQQLPAGWAWEWLIQEDSTTGDVAELLSRLLPGDDVRISLGMGRRSGPGVTRNLALARARGQVVKVLDADDQLAPGALARDLAVLDAHPDVAWTTSRVLDLFPDGSTAGFEHDPPEGRLDGAQVVGHWRAHHYRAAVHPATLCMRREHLLAVGGWMALPASEDTGLLIALAMIGPGWFLRDVGLLYRKWSGQNTSSAAHREPQEWEARMRLIDDRAKALAAIWQPIRETV
jgi:glycosyltransferase involved in cell wall biosynthesis